MVVITTTTVTATPHPQFPPSPPHFSHFPGHTTPPHHTTRGRSSALDLLSSASFLPSSLPPLVAGGTASNSMRIPTATFLLALMLAGTSAAVQQPCDFPAIFNFGDSNSDTGGLSAAFGAAPPPNGETFFGEPMGRYCDGRLVVDFIAERLGVAYLHAYLDSLGANFSHGANFATAGSSITRQNASLFISGFSPFSLDVQSWQFSQFKSRSQRIIRNPTPAGSVFSGLLPGEDYFSRALYTFDIGQNDLTARYFANQTTEEVLAGIPDILTKFVVAIQSIYGEGGRYFWIHNTGPFGCLPYVLERLPVTAPQVDRTGCAAPFNAVAQAFNTQLKQAVALLRRDLPLATFTYVDVYTAKYSLFSQPRKYGFKHPLVSCCGHGGKYNYNRQHGCGSEAVVNGTRVVLGKSCDDPSERIIWDGVHYTEAANKWIFDLIAEGQLSDPPTPLRMACRRQPR